jgi:hypothetical protein
VHALRNIHSALVPNGLLVDTQPISAHPRVSLELSERFGVGQHLRMNRAEGANWAYVDGRWDEAGALANELLALAEAGDPDYSDSPLLALRGWIAFARADIAAAAADIRRAVELARTRDLQAQSQAYCIGGLVAVATGRRDEADDLASDLAALGPRSSRR